MNTPRVKESILIKINAILILMSVILCIDVVELEIKSEIVFLLI